MRKYTRNQPKHADEVVEMKLLTKLRRVIQSHGTHVLVQMLWWNFRPQGTPGNPFLSRKLLMCLTKSDPFLFKQWGVLLNFAQFLSRCEQYCAPQPYKYGYTVIRYGYPYRTVGAQRLTLYGTVPEGSIPYINRKQTAVYTGCWKLFFLVK